MSLILTRSINEEIRIGTDITVRVIGIQRGQVRIAVDAPKDIPVHRSEIYDRIERDRALGVSRHSDSGCNTTRFAR
jgi:carbon storage regulator